MRSREAMASRRGCALEEPAEYDSSTGEHSESEDDILMNPESIASVAARRGTDVDPAVAEPLGPAGQVRDPC